MYSSGSDEMSDFLAFELLEGYLYVILDLGSGPVREKAYTFPLNDGEWHHVVFERDLAIGIINVGTLAFMISIQFHKMLRYTIPRVATCNVLQLETYRTIHFTKHVELIAKIHDNGLKCIASYISCSHKM